jgi:two-component system sensor histidine kinase CpxA
MRVRLPLYGKILAWFFLNLVIVGTVFAFLFDAQFHFNLDWFVLTGARERMEALRDLIIGELDVTPPDEWAQVLKRYSEAHHLRLGLFDEDAVPLVGDTANLPADVRTRIVERPTFSSDTQPATPRLTESRRRWPRPPLRAIMRTTHPTQYWILASARLDNMLAGDPMRVVLVARASSISAGGLILNPTPWLTLGGGIFIFSLLFWLPLVRGITRTVARMVQATKQIADGHFDVRVNLRRRDELGSLADSIDQMATRLDGLVTGQKRFLGDIAHELCAPLARLQMALGILEQHASDEQTPFVRSASEKASQIAALVGELLSFSKASLSTSPIELRSVSLASTVADAVHRERTEGAEFRVEVPADLHVSANPELLTRALSNLLRNAIQHAAKSGPVTIHAERTATGIAITVSDSGTGVPEEDLTKIFDAFYRVDPSRTRDTGGAGLGLAIVKTCVEACFGTVTARNREPHGLEVRIQLHAAAPVPAAAVEEVPSPNQA